MTPSYRTTPRFWLVFILTILVICSISACGGGSTDDTEQPINQSCTVYPPDFVGPRKPCPAL